MTPVKSTSLRATATATATVLPPSGRVCKMFADARNDVAPGAPNDIASREACMYTSKRLHDKYRVPLCLQHYMIVYTNMAAITNFGADKWTINYTLCLKKRQWCSTLYLQRTFTDFGNFLQRYCWVSTLLNGDLLSHLPLLVSLHYLGKHEPRYLVFSVMLYTENNTDFACYIFYIHQPILIIFGRK